MNTQRFVLTYTGQGAMPPGDVARLEKRVAVLDHSRRSLLVEVVPTLLDQLLLTMPAWQAELEQIQVRVLSGAGKPSSVDL